MDNASLTRLVNEKKKKKKKRSQPGQSLIVSVFLNSWETSEAACHRYKGTGSSMQLSVNEDALAIQSFLSPSL